jgi:hypothetical protein
MQNMQSLNEQMAMLVRTHKHVPSYYESGPHTSGLWCTNVGCPDPAGHTSQFCLMLLPQQSHGVPPAQHQPQPAHVQPYRPPHRAGQAKPTAQSNARPQPTPCPTCGKIHVVGRCWIENNVICGNCGGQHPTDWCRRPDKIMELQPPLGDYPQQARENQRGTRVNELVEPSGPSNLYYDHLNQRQTQRAPAVVQTNQGVFPLANAQSSQDVRFAQAHSNDAPNLQTNYVDMTPTDQKNQQVMVVLKSGRKMDQDIGLSIIEEGEEPEEEVASQGSLEEDHDFPQLNETMREAANEVQFEHESSLAAEPDEDEYQHVNKEPRTLYRGKSDKANNPSGPYDIWDDLAYTKANISFGQLIQLAPSLRK